MAKIKTIKSREILNAIGIPTIETLVVLDSGACGVASLPSTKSRGTFESVPLLDQDPERFEGKGVLKAIANVEQKIAPVMIGMDISLQNKIDQVLVDLDGTEDRRNLGANALLSVSLACLKAAANAYHLPVYKYLWLKYQLVSKNTPLPTMVFTLISGGEHGKGNLDFQEFLIVPSSRFSPTRSLEIATRLYRKLAQVLMARHISYSVADDGGLTANLFTNIDGLELLRETVAGSAFNLNTDLFLAVDFGASHFYKNASYAIKDRPQAYTSSEFQVYLEELDKQYHLLFWEDPLSSDDWEGWKKLTGNLGSKKLILGDDLLGSNNVRITQALGEKAGNGMVIKINQNSTVTESIQAVKKCKASGWQVVVSGRSSETNDEFIADFALGIGANYTKFGAPFGGEHIAKYNRLSAIASEMGVNV